MAFGGWLMASACGPGGRILAIWIIGAGLNYAPLTACAIALSRPAGPGGQARETVSSPLLPLGWDNARDR